MFSVTYTIPSPTFLDTPGAAIPDGAAAALADTMVVCKVGIITDVRIAIGITHTWRDDLDITLTSPSGTAVLLATDIDTSTDDFRVIFSDAAAADVSTYVATAVVDSATYAGFPSFNPEGAVVLSAFDGETADGTWTLTVDDDAAADIGTLDRWALAFNGDVSVF